MSAAIPAVRFSGVRRQFGEVRAIDDLGFEVADGEFFSLLGPSGSGTTTCLRLIAGFEQPDAGAIEIHGVNVAGVPPYQRDVNTVFQDYALFPHMSVGQNVEYGLMIRKVAAAERSGRADEMLELVKLAGMRSRKPAQLSGGQRQRVALARALINRPRVLLLDEPLGALDLKLREQMQVELKALQRQIGITFIYVTHDQGEALSMSDRVAVFNLGRIEQIDTPAAIYEHPATAFVAGFVGVSNLCEGEVAKRLSGAAEPFAIRPEKIRIAREDAAPPDGWVGATGRVESTVYLGAATRYVVALDGGGSLTVLHQNADDRDQGPVAGARVRLAWQPRHQQRLGGQRPGGQRP
ncbi:MAG TPA: ABC transporter ATP-binding protein [Burkholderiales bacterium]|nr:ABC transporter ATP-binding protein [Burkholderiales bacterium]